MGGAETYLVNLCKYLSSINTDYMLFCPKDRKFISLAQDNNLDIFSWKTYGKFDPVSILKFVKLIKKQKISIIHTHLSTAAFIGSFSAKIAGVKCVSHVHGINTATSYRRADKIIAVSNAAKTHLVNQGIAEDKIIVIHNGVDIRYYQPDNITSAKEKLGLKLDIPIFGIFGRLTKIKGQQIAIVAFNKFLKKYPNSMLIITGEGIEKSNLEQLAENYGIKNNILFAGYQNDIKSYMNACDIVLVPSIKEGFGLSAIEAMALEKPVIASDTGGLVEIIENEISGLFFQSGNSDSLAEAMIYLYTNPNKKELGINGRRRVIENFEINNQNQKVLDLLKKVSVTNNKYLSSSLS
ncbi:MAG: glycosyltransferase family 4 protein [Armatimonadota bacterium]